MAQDTQQNRAYLDYSGLTYYTKKVMSWFGILSIDEIDEIFVEQYLATGQLTYKYNNEFYSLAYFSIGALERADNFKKIFNTFKQGKDYKQYLNNSTGNTCKKCGKPIPRGLKYCEDCVDKSSTIKRLFSFYLSFYHKILV